ncbi:MAG TPA: hypothetical protein VEB18_00770 [Candidatus Paceibacterota bacterium]|nr:hypothetical protein [Candidatus Paceibacterota bacterium]
MTQPFALTEFLDPRSAAVLAAVRSGAPVDLAAAPRPKTAKQRTRKSKADHLSVVVDNDRPAPKQQKRRPESVVASFYGAVDYLNNATKDTPATDCQHALRAILRITGTGKLPLNLMGQAKNVFRQAKKHGDLTPELEAQAKARFGSLSRKKKKKAKAKPVEPAADANASSAQS